MKTRLKLQNLALNGHSVSASVFIRVLFLLLCLLFVAAVLFALLRYRSQAQARFVRFPNGTTMEFVGSRLGGASFTIEKPWESWVRPFLPRKLSALLPRGASGSCSSGPNSLTLYFSEPRLQGASVPSPWKACYALGDDDFQYERQGGSCSFGGPPKFIGLTLRAYPRTQSSFWFVFTDQQGAELARVRIPNPPRPQLQPWLPAPLPQAQTNGPVTLVLRSGVRAGSGPYFHLNAQWDVFSADPLWSGVRPMQPMLSDATGNEGNWLPPKEDVWKVRAVLRRSGFGVFRPEERLVVSNITFPKPSEFTRLNASATVAGAEVLLECFSSAGELTISNGVTLGVVPRPGPQGGGHSTTSGSFGRVDTWERNKPFAFVKVSGLEEHDVVRCRLIDASGVIQEESRSHWDTQNDTRIYTPEFDPPSTSTFTFEIVVSRALVFHFFVRPPDLLATPALDSPPAD